MKQGWAVVTGASSGIGLEFTRELMRRGYPVLGIARRRDRLGALAKDVADAGGHMEALTADLSTE
jgi:short-subunit dehydrogenase